MRILLDTNVLVLWIAGTLKPSLIGSHKKLSNFDQDDFSLVRGIALSNTNHISTPHVLTEVANTLGSGEKIMVQGGSVALAKYISRLDESFIPAREIIAIPEFLDLGLTDAAIFHLARSDTCVVSVDFNLCNRLAGKGIDVVNPRNLRSL